MGSGEPLDNYDNVMKFLRLLNREDGLHMSLRERVAVHLRTGADACTIWQTRVCRSRCAYRCTRLTTRFAASTMPIANKYAMDDILAACRNYIDKTGRRVIFEYALVSGVNCSRESAHELAARLRGMQCHVNLIPLNDVPERDLRAPYEGEMRAFEDELKHLHISVSRRREMGDDIEGACGQLRRAYIGSGAPDAGEGDAR